MGFRFSKRISLGKGFGLNISRSGITPNLRTKWGSIGPRGFSIKTGLPGVSFTNPGGCMVIVLFGLLFMVLVIVSDCIKK